MKSQVRSSRSFDKSFQSREKSLNPIHGLIRVIIFSSASVFFLSAFPLCLGQQVQGKVILDGFDLKRGETDALRVRISRLNGAILGEDSDGLEDGDYFNIQTSPGTIETGQQYRVSVEVNYRSYRVTNPKNGIFEIYYLDESYPIYMHVDISSYDEPDFRISWTGTDGDSGPDAQSPKVLLNEPANEYLVSWIADEQKGGDYHSIIRLQRFGSGSLAPVGPTSELVAIPTNEGYVSTFLAVYNPTSQGYLILWREYYYNTGGNSRLRYVLLSSELDQLSPISTLSEGQSYLGECGFDLNRNNFWIVGVDVQGEEFSEWLQRLDPVGGAPGQRSFLNLEGNVARVVLNELEDLFLVVSYDENRQLWGRHLDPSTLQPMSDRVPLTQSPKEGDRIAWQDLVWNRWDNSYTLFWWHGSECIESSTPIWCYGLNLKGRRFQGESLAGLTDTTVIDTSYGGEWNGLTLDTHSHLTSDEYVIVTHGRDNQLKALRLDVDSLAPGGGGRMLSNNRPDSPFGWGGGYYLAARPDTACNPSTGKCFTVWQGSEQTEWVGTNSGSQDFEWEIFGLGWFPEDKVIPDRFFPVSESSTLGSGSTVVSESSPRFVRRTELELDRTRIMPSERAWVVDRVQVEESLFVAGAIVLRTKARLSIVVEGVRLEAAELDIEFRVSEVGVRRAALEGTIVSATIDSLVKSLLPQDVRSLDSDLIGFVVSNAVLNWSEGGFKLTESLNNHSRLYYEYRGYDSKLVVEDIFEPGFFRAPASGSVTASTTTYSFDGLTRSHTRTFSITDSPITGEILAEPNPITECASPGLGAAEVQWTVEEGTRVEVRIDSPTGKLFLDTVGSGSKVTGNWVKNEMTFYLVDKSNGAVLDSVSVLVNCGCTLPEGHADYCRECGPCEEGQGDCDPGQCQGNLTCVNDVGADYGWASNIDVCEVSTGCTLPEGHADYCRECGPCEEGQGDCDPGQCQSGLQCVNDVGSQYGWPSIIDVCQSSPIEPSIIAQPNPLVTCEDTGQVEILWDVPASQPIEIRINSPDGKKFLRTVGSGSKQTGTWVRNGMQFYLVDPVTERVLDSMVVSFYCPNLAPNMSDQFFSIPEMSPSGTLVGRVVATDPDPGDTLTFFLNSNTTHKAFSVDATSGDISVVDSDPLDYERKNTFLYNANVIDSQGAGAAARITIKLTDIVECENPSSPSLTILQGDATTASSYTVTWTGTSPENIYQLQEATNSNFVGATSYSLSSTSQLLNPSVTQTTRYYYRVRAGVVCQGQNYWSSWSSIIYTVVQPKCLSPARPSLISPSFATNGQDYVVSWNSTSPDNTFQLQEATNPSFSQPVTYTVNGTSRSFRHDVFSQTRFYYRVRAIAFCGGQTYRSLWSAYDYTDVQVLLNAELGSQMFFLVDTGMDIANSGFTVEQLTSRSVFDLTGVSGSNRNRIVIRNSDPVRSVTLVFRYYTDKCQDFLDFLVYLGCGDSLTINPTDFTIPETSFNVKARIFGPAGALLTPISAAEFGSGRFIVMVSAVGARTGEISYPPAPGYADILFSKEVVESGNLLGTCNVRANNTGSYSGLTSENLQICNAVPITFNYLDGYQTSATQTCSERAQGPNSSLIQAVQPLLDFGLRQFGSSLYCLDQSEPSGCNVIEVFGNLDLPECGNDVGTTVILPFDGSTGRIWPY